MQLTTENLSAFVGGQLEIMNQGEDYIYRGQIEQVAVVDIDGTETVEVRFSWLAKGKNGFPPQGWVKDDTLEYSADTSIYPAADIGDGRVAMSGIMTGEMVVFYPPNGSRLDPSKVEGLTLTS